MVDELNTYLRKSNNGIQTSYAGASEPLSLVSRADVNQHGQRTQLAVTDTEGLCLLPSDLVTYHGSSSQIKVNA